MTTVKKIMPLESTGERFLPEWGGESELEHMHRYVLSCELVDKMDVLDIASGEGYGSYMLAEKANSVIGVDISQEAITHARANYKQKNLKFLIGSCEEIPLADNTIDVVVSFETIEHHDKHDEMISEIKRVLKPNGTLIISSPDKRNYSEGPGIANPYHIKELYEEEFKLLINNNFKKTAFFGQRISHGSYVVRDDKIDSLINYKKTPKKVEKNKSNYLPVFWIAIASDVKLPNLPSSVFENHLDEISLLKSVLSDRNQYVLHLEAAIKSRDLDNEAVKKVVSERDVFISHLEAAIKSRDLDNEAVKKVVSERDLFISHLEAAIKSRDFDNEVVKKVVSERDLFISHLQSTLKKRDNEQGLLDERILKDAAKLATQEDYIDVQHKYISHLEAIEREQIITMRRQHEVFNDRNSYINHLEGAITKYELNISELNNENHALKLQTGQLTEEIFNRDIAVENMYNSRSWRLTAPLRRLRKLDAQIYKPYHDDQPKLSSEAKASSPKVSSHTTPAFFTICSKNFLAHARVLYRSIKEHYPTSAFLVVLCDELDGYLDPTKEPFEFVYLDDLGISDYHSMSQRYNITEFNTAVKPFAFLHLMNKLGFERVMYLDPDLLFVSKMEELDRRLDAGAEAVLTPHIIQPKENDEIHDSKFLQFGIYNLGFLAVRKTLKVLEFMEWWGRRLEHECVIRLEDGLFVDQKWADLLPAFVPGAEVINHPGYNVAYWNLPNRSVVNVNGNWQVNEQALRFVHFSGNKIDDPNVFSRHSQQVRVDNIGDLRGLLKYYADSVFEQGHQFYRKLPYAYSWDGQAGVNLHTPKDLDVSASETSLAEQPPYIASNNRLSLGAIKDILPESSNVNYPQNKLFRKVRVLKTALPIAKRIHGGWLPLAARAFQSYRDNGLQHVKERGLAISQYKLPQKLPEVPNTSQELGKSNPGKRLLYMDWGIPKPDHDAGSLWSVTLMKVFQSLGYEVTFMPCNLEYVEGYYENLVELGIDVCCHPKVKSVELWIENNAAKFDVFLLSRGPVVCWFYDAIKEHSQNAKIIYNTADLHYMRELREAELTNDVEALEKAEITKRQEIGLAEKCDVTIVHSVAEAYLLRQDAPETPLLSLPLLFENMPGPLRQFNQRDGAVFIGGFNHQPNVDAVLYFIEDIFPGVRSLIPDFKLHIVGSNPPDEILSKSDIPGVIIHGFVKNIDELFDSVKMSVAPLRYGAGIKGKIGTSFCYGLPCVASPIAAEGMNLTDGENIAIGKTAQNMISQIVTVHNEIGLWATLSQGGLKFAQKHYSFDAVKTQVAKIVGNLNDNRQPLKSFYEISEWSSAQLHMQSMGDEYKERIQSEVSLLPEVGIEGFYTKGHCAVCKVDTEFLTSYMYTTHDTPCGRPMPNWREHMQCPSCGLVNRMRAALHIFESFYRPKASSRIYITERVTQTYDWLEARFPKLQGSEYYGSEYVPGSIVDGQRHEDVQNLSFSDNSFDYILSFDVLEHVPDPDSAFAQIYRTLDSGGALIFSVPFAADSYDDIVRASLDEEGNLIHHMEPEYHGNPVDPEGGALCYRYLGWSSLDRLRAIGFINVRIVAYWSKSQGYLGREQYMFIAEKP